MQRLSIKYSDSEVKQIRCRMVYRKSASDIPPRREKQYAGDGRHSQERSPAAYEVGNEWQNGITNAIAKIYGCHGESYPSWLVQHLGPWTGRAHKWTLRWRRWCHFCNTGSVFGDALSPSMSVTAREHIELSPLRQFTKQNMTQLTDAACISVVTDLSTTMEKSTGFLPNLEDRVQTNIKLTDCSHCEQTGLLLCCPL